MSLTSVAAGQAMFSTLKSLGVTHVFGMPGTQTVPLFEALRQSGLNTVVPTHELAASFMAGAFYRVAGRPAALLTIPGPGFAYALTGLAEARLDSAALIHIVPAAEEGPSARFALQAIPQTNLAASLAKAVLTVPSESDLATAIERAFAIATSGEPGPVVVQLDDKAQRGDMPSLASNLSGGVGATHALDRVIERVHAARRPVIYAGQGCLGAAPVLLELVEHWGAPVLTTPSARGIVPEDHHLVMGFDTHRDTTDAVNELLVGADLVLVIGARLGHNGTAGHHVKFDPARTIHVDTDAAVLGRVCPLESCVNMRAEDFLAQVSRQGLSRSSWSDSQVATARTAIGVPAARAAEPIIAGVSTARFFAALRATLPRDCIMVTDTGLHQVMARRHFPVLAPGGLLTPSDFQSMGFGLPAAIAAKLAAPERPVVALIGDGGLCMSGMELATAAGLGLPLPVLVFDDGKLNQIRLSQQAAFGSDFGTTLPGLDFSALAAATGVRFAEVESDPAPTLTAALSAGGPTLLRVPVGDSPGIRRVRTVARAKALVRAGLGERLVSRLRGRR